MLAPFACRSAREAADTFLGRGIDAETDTPELALARTEVDDRTSAGLEVWQSGLHVIERAKQAGFKRQSDGGVVDLFERHTGRGTLRVVHHHVETAEAGYRRCDVTFGRR